MIFLYRLLVYSGLFYAISAVALVLSMGQALGYSGKSFVAGACFSGLLLANGYGGIYSDAAEKGSTDARAMFLRENHGYAVFLPRVTVMMACLWMVWQSAFSWLFAATVAGCLLSIFILAKLYLKRPWQLRRNPWFKNAILSFIWVLVLALPFIENQKFREPAVFASLAENALFIYMLCSVFDLKDAAKDAKQGMKTWANRLRLSAFYLRVILPVFVGWMMAREYTAFTTAATATTAFAMLCMFMFAARPRPLWFYLVLVDGMMVIKAAADLYFTVRTNH